MTPVCVRKRVLWLPGYSFISKVQYKANAGYWYWDHRAEEAQRVLLALIFGLWVNPIKTVGHNDCTNARTMH